MTVQFARPDVAELTFQVFERSVHPELTAAFARRRFEQEDYTAEICIGEAGHVIAFCRPSVTLTEVAASRQQPLPTQRRSFRHALRGSRHRALHLPAGIHYEVSFHVEDLVPEVFLNFHQELLIDSSRVELSHRFPSPTRFSPEPLSLIRADAQPASLLIHTYHTFPDNCAVVKSQSLFELI